MATELPPTADELNPATLCIHCMQRKPMLAPCPACGHKDIPSKQHPLYLKPRTLLKQQYIVGKALGQGGFGITYIGFDRWLHKKVAIKEYLPAALATRDFREASVIPLKRQELAFTQGLGLFIEEARNLAKFDHPHIVRVLNFFEENQTGYMVMDYLEGNSLGDYLAQHGGKLSLTQALEIFRPILDALDAVHAEHLYHRDISAQNIRMLTNGTPILIDFGAARHVIGEHSHTLDLVLKHGYSPIEQYSGRGKIGAWTDIYACGALLYLLLTGSLPPAATDRLSEEPLLPLNSLPAHVEATILKALALKAEQRFSDISGFKAALYEEIVPQIEQVPKKSKKIPQFALLIIIALVVGLATEKMLILQKVEQLQQQARQQWASLQLTTPPNNNVYVTYQKLLEIDPKNNTARQGLQQLSQHFLNLARTQQQQADFNAALATVEQGLRIAPQAVELRTLQQVVTVQIQQAARAQKITEGLKLAEKLIAQGQLEEAQQQYQSLQQFAPEDERVPNALNNLVNIWARQLHNSHEAVAPRLTVLNKLLNTFPQHPELLALKAELTAPKPVDELLHKAEQHLMNSRLSEPKGENAYELYQQVLNLEPEQVQAKQGIQKIADNYEQRAERESNPAKALLWVNKGLKVLPTHAGLLNLQKTLTAPQSVSAPPEPVKPQAAPIITPTPPPPTPSAPPEPNVNGLLQTAQQQLEREQWDMAGQNYQAVLKLVADNAQAQQGLQKIATHYLQLARKAQQQAHWVDSLSLINKGLQFVPHHTGLLGLQRDAMQQLNEPAVNPTPPNLILTPSF
ncbi:MAG: serine/threonine-protein kinase [Thiotrichaceae bacterium]|nr:serine/threonine-protein kinase [Thiotrichaceae bacterium]